MLADIEGDTVDARPADIGRLAREVDVEDHPAEGGRPAFRFVTLERAEP